MSTTAPNGLRNRLARLVVNVETWREAARMLGVTPELLKRVTRGHHVWRSTIERLEKEINRVEGKTS